MGRNFEFDAHFNDNSVSFCTWLTDNKFLCWIGCHGLSDAGQDRSRHCTQAVNSQKRRYCCRHFWRSDSRKRHPWRTSQQGWYLQCASQEATTRTQHRTLVFGRQQSALNECRTSGSLPFCPTFSYPWSFLVNSMPLLLCNVFMEENKSWQLYQYNPHKQLVRRCKGRTGVKRRVVLISRSRLEPSAVESRASILILT